jgi:hypothetical protein
MKRLGGIALGVLVLLGLTLAGGALLPRRWRAERAIFIAARPEQIHPFLSDLRRWADWAPWAHGRDPKAVWTYAGPDRGVGARCAWTGPVVGTGRMEIIRSDPSTGLTLDEAIESDAVNARATFTYAVDGGTTLVTWVDEGTLPPVLGGFFRTMVEDRLQDDFTRGLETLKSTVEEFPPQRFDASTEAATAGEPHHDAGSP